jgi:hypothetical protein
MPFKPQVFRESVTAHLADSTPPEVVTGCADYASAATYLQRAKCIQQMIDALDRAVDEDTRRSIIERCGRRCLGASTLAKARRLVKEAQDLDNLLSRLNAAHIGGGRLERRGTVIWAAYDRCYCGSVSKTRDRFSATYCYCSCGWYRQLFEALLERPVSVELQSSIIQGDERCAFLIRVDTLG